MPDENNNNTNTSQNNNGSKQVVIACDINNENDQQYEDIVGQILEQGGYTVEKLPIGPNEFASYSYSDKAKGKQGVYLMAASLVSFLDASDANFDYNVFGIRGDVSSYGTKDGFQSKGVPKDHHGDCIHSRCDELAGKTYPELNQIYQGKCQAVPGETPEELGKNILTALGGGTLNSETSTNSQGGSAVLIQDKTFYGLIKQICGAVDAIFTIANNMVYLLSFKDIYEYRNQFDAYIPIIEKKDVLQNSCEKNWSESGYYNAVEVTYKDGVIKYQNDVLVKQYGENIFYYDFPEDDEETAKAKADALLAAHIRDYSTNIQLSIFYNEQITEGSWVKVNKTITQISGKTRKEIEQDALRKQNKPIQTKRKGINITNLIEKTLTENNITKTIQTITDEEGNVVDVEVDKTEYELFFVQGYTCRWDKDNSLIQDLELKYGPDTPDDPINATVGFGGVSNESGASGGLYGNDTFTIDDICVANNEKILPAYEGGARVQEVKELVNGKYAPEPSDYQPRANQNSNYAKKYSQMKSPAEVFSAFRSEYQYSKYSDNSSCWTNATDFYDNAGKTANCGDTTCLLKVFFDCIGVPSCGVHIDGHYFNAIQINGVWEIIDGVRLDNQTCNFADGSGYSFGNPNPCDSYKQNNTGGNI